MTTRLCVRPYKKRPTSKLYSDNNNNNNNNTNNVIKYTNITIMMMWTRGAVCVCAIFHYTMYVRLYGAPHAVRVARQRYARFHVLNRGKIFRKLHRDQSHYLHAHVLIVFRPEEMRCVRTTSWCVCVWWPVRRLFDLHEQSKWIHAYVCIITSTIEWLLPNSKAFNFQFDDENLCVCTRRRLAVCARVY